MLKMWRLLMSLAVLMIVIQKFVICAPALDTEFQWPQSNFEDLASLVGNSYDGEEINKRGNSMWFGPRLGKRAKSSYDDISKDKMSSKSINLLNYLADHPNVKIVAKEGSKNYPTVIYLSPQNPDEQFYNNLLTPRLGREAADQHTENLNSRPFPPRFGRSQVFSPRLG